MGPRKRQHSFLRRIQTLGNSHPTVSPWVCSRVSGHVWRRPLTSRLGGAVAPRGWQPGLPAYSSSYIACTPASHGGAPLGQSKQETPSGESRQCLSCMGGCLLPRSSAVLGGENGKQPQMTPASFQGVLASVTLFTCARHPLTPIISPRNCSRVRSLVEHTGFGPECFLSLDRRSKLEKSADNRPLPWPIFP